MHFQKLIYSPISIKHKMVEKHHNSKIYKHLKVGKIMKHTQRDYCFLEIKKLMKKHIAVCAECNQNKIARHKSYEKIKTFKISGQT